MDRVARHASKMGPSSHSILSGPFSGSGFILGSVVLVDVGNLRH